MSKEINDVSRKTIKMLTTDVIVDLAKFVDTPIDAMLNRHNMKDTKNLPKELEALDSESLQQLQNIGASIKGKVSHKQENIVKGEIPAVSGKDRTPATTPKGIPTHSGKDRTGPGGRG